MWYLYILQCQDRSLYTGITTNLTRRLKTHNAGKGSRAIRGKLPAKLVFKKRCLSRSTALVKEAAIKRLTHKQKLAMVKKSGCCSEANRADVPQD